MHRVSSRCEYGGVKPLTDISEDPETALSIIFPLVFDHDRGTPIEFRNQIKRQTALLDIGGVFGGVVSDLRYLLYPRKIGLESLSLVMLQGNRGPQLGGA